MDPSTTQKLLISTTIKRYPHIQLEQLVCLGYPQILPEQSVKDLTFKVKTIPKDKEGSCALCGNQAYTNNSFLCCAIQQHPYSNSGCQEFCKSSELCIVCFKNVREIIELRQQKLRNSELLDNLGSTIRTVQRVNKLRCGERVGSAEGTVSVVIKNESKNDLKICNAPNKEDSCSPVENLTLRSPSSEKEASFEQNYKQKSVRRTGTSSFCHKFATMRNLQNTPLSNRKKLLKCRNINGEKRKPDGRSVRHYREHCRAHPLVSYKESKTCYFCKEHFRYRSLLETHMRLHLSERVRLKCSHCPESFLSGQALTAHMIRCHGTAEEKDKLRKVVVENNKKFTVKYKEKSLKCYFCPIGFPFLTYLARHMRLMHTLERNYYHCPNCGKTFLHKDHLKHHSILVCGTEQKAKLELAEKRRGQRKKHFSKIAAFLKCYFCGKLLTSKLGLEKHVGTHTMEGDLYNCRVCKKRFVTKMFLEQHEILVCGTDPSKEAEFRRKVKEKNAQKKLKFPKCTKCPTCCKKIAQGKVSSHFLSCNPMLNARRFCRSCNERFLSWQEKKIHDRLNHGHEGKVWTCYFCRKQFLTRSTLETHFVTHTHEKFYKCKNCGKRFKWVHGIKFHLRKSVCKKAVLLI